VKTRVVLRRPGKTEVDDVNGYDLGKINILLAFYDPFGIQPAPVEQAPFVHVALVPDLQFNVDQSPVLQFSPGIQNTAFAADNVGGEHSAFHDCYRNEPFRAGTFQNRVQEGQKLAFVAPLTHNFVE